MPEIQHEVEVGILRARETKLSVFIHCLLQILRILSLPMVFKYQPNIYSELKAIYRRIII